MQCWNTPDDGQWKSPKHVEYFTKINLRNCTTCWFYYKNISRCTVLWMSNSFTLNQVYPHWSLLLKAILGFKFFNETVGNYRIAWRRMIGCKWWIGLFQGTISLQVQLSWWVCASYLRLRKQQEVKVCRIGWRQMFRFGEHGNELLNPQWQGTSWSAEWLWTGFSS